MPWRGPRSQLHVQEGQLLSNTRRLARTKSQVPAKLAGSTPVPITQRTLEQKIKRYSTLFITEAMITKQVTWAGPLAVCREGGRDEPGKGPAFAGW